MKHDRHPDDFYATPGWVTRAILPWVTLGENPVDPSCGDGAILSQIGHLSPRPWGIEIDPDRARAAHGLGFYVHERSALSPAPWEQVGIAGVGPSSAVIMNPPFRHALAFVQRALRETSGPVVALLRLAFLESAERAAFHVANPSDVYVLAQRPSFAHEGKTDKTAYAWFVWPVACYRSRHHRARIRVLDCAAEQAAHRSERKRAAAAVAAAVP